MQGIRIAEYSKGSILEHSAIFSTFIKLPFVINIFLLSIFERPFYIGFTILNILQQEKGEVRNDFIFLTTMTVK